MGMLHNIQLAMSRHLVGDSWMAGIDVITQNEGDLDTMIRTTLSRLGIVATISMGKAGRPMQNTGLYFEEVVYVVEVQEYVAKNRGAQGTGKPVLDVCERIAWRLHNFEVAPGTTLYCVDPGIIPVTISPPATAAYAVAFETSDGVDPTPQQEG